MFISILNVQNVSIQLYSENYFGFKNAILHTYNAYSPSIYNHFPAFFSANKFWKVSGTSEFEYTVMFNEGNDLQDG